MKVFTCAALLTMCLIASPGGLDSQSSKSLADCQARLAKSQDEALVTYIQNKELAQKIQELQAKSENVPLYEREEALPFVGLGVGLGVGLFAIWATLRTLRRARPLSQVEKRLAVLISVALWVAVAAISANVEEATLHKVVRAVLDSVPAVLFAGIAFWRIGRESGEGN